MELLEQEVATTDGHYPWLKSKVASVTYAYAVAESGIYRYGATLCRHISSVKGTVRDMTIEDILGGGSGRGTAFTISM